MVLAILREDLSVDEGAIERGSLLDEASGSRRKIVRVLRRMDALGIEVDHVDVRVGCRVILLAYL